MANPTGESESDALRLDFDRRLMLQFRGSMMTSDAGLLAYPELEDAFGLSVMASSGSPTPLGRPGMPAAGPPRVWASGQTKNRYGSAQCGGQLGNLVKSMPRAPKPNFLTGL
jgi:hypothetical protein